MGLDIKIAVYPCGCVEYLELGNKHERCEKHVKGGEPVGEGELSRTIITISTEKEG